MITSNLTPNTQARLLTSTPLPSIVFSQLEKTGAEKSITSIPYAPTFLTDVTNQNNLSKITKSYLLKHEKINNPLFCNFNLNTLPQNKFAKTYGELPSASSGRLSNYPGFVTAMVEVKKAYAIANTQAGKIPPEIGDAIKLACNEILDNPKKYLSGLSIPFYSSGCRTPFNMDINYLIAHMANHVLTTQGRKAEAHANDHVNCGQSTNDTVPAANIIFFYRITGKLNKLVEQLLHNGGNKLLPHEIESIQLSLNNMEKWREKVIQNLPLLGTAVGHGDTAEGLEKFLYPILKKTTGIKNLNVNPNLAAATYDTYAYYEFASLTSKPLGQTLAAISKRLQNLPDYQHFKTALQDMRFLGQFVSEAGHKIITTAHQEGSIFHLNSFDPQLDWQVSADIERLGQITQAMSAVLERTGQANSHKIGELSHSEPEILSLRSMNATLKQQANTMIQACENLAKRNQGKIWLGYTEYQAAVPVSVKKDLESYAALLKSRFSSLKTLANEPDFKDLVSDLSQNKSISKQNAKAQNALRSYKTEICGLASDIKKINRDLMMRSMQREVTLPELVPGSSIMPGKVNPILCEYSAMMATESKKLVSFLSSGKITEARHFKHMFSAIQNSLTQSVSALEKVFDGMEVNEAVSRSLIEKSGAFVTKLRDRVSPDGFRITYDVAAKLGALVNKAKKADPCRDLSAIMAELKDDKGQRWLSDSTIKYMLDLIKQPADGVDVSKVIV